MGNSGIGLENLFSTLSGQKLFLVKLITTEERMRELARAVGYVRKRGGSKPCRPVRKMIELEMGIPEERMIAMAKEVGFISRGQVLEAIHDGASKTAHELVRPHLPIDLRGQMRKRQRQYLVEAMRQAKGNKAAAGKLLGIKRTTVIAWLDRHKVAESEYQT